MNNIDIRLPAAVGGKNTDAALAEMQRYLFQLAQQLNVALKDMDKGIQSVSASAKETRETVEYDKKHPEGTFAGIKSLIIKSADIVNAYYERINQKLAGEYVAVSDYGEFREQTEAGISGNAKQIELAFRNQQSITSDLEEVTNQVINVTAYINAGLLYEDAEGLPVYGLEIGQQSKVDGTEVFRKYLRMIANRISFFDENDVEVAYMSGKKLYITDAEIGTMRVDTATIGTIVVGDYSISVGADGSFTIS